MKAVGIARRGDVVFVQQLEPWQRQKDLDGFAAAAQQLHAETGVTIVVLAPQLRVVAPPPARRRRARCAPAPRWARSLA